jgi:hypothetical protein
MFKVESLSDENPYCQTECQTHILPVAAGKRVLLRAVHLSESLRPASVYLESV